MQKEKYDLCRQEQDSGHGRNGTEYIKMRNEEEKFVCWVSEEEKIISFHFEDGYKKKNFSIRKEYLQYIRLFVAEGYKIQ